MKADRDGRITSDAIVELKRQVSKARTMRMASLKKLSQVSEEAESICCRKDLPLEDDLTEDPVREIAID